MATKQVLREHINNDRGSESLRAARGDTLVSIAEFPRRPGRESLGGARAEKRSEARRGDAGRVVRGAAKTQ